MEFVSSVATCLPSGPSARKVRTRGRGGVATLVGSCERKETHGEPSSAPARKSSDRGDSAPENCDGGESDGGDDDSELAERGTSYGWLLNTAGSAASATLGRAFRLGCARGLRDNSCVESSLGGSCGGAILRATRVDNNESALPASLRVPPAAQSRQEQWPLLCS